MSPRTLTYSGTLTITSCWCGIKLAIPDDLYKIARRDHKQGIFCPLGHTFIFSGDTEEQRLRKELQWSQDEAARNRAERDQIEASRRAWKGQVTRLRNRVVEGDCPLCGQHLRDLARHMGRIHPDETPRDLTEGETVGPE